MSQYTKDLQRHLTAYKGLRLGVREAGIFLHKGKEVRCGHILPKELKWLNVIEPFRSEIRTYLDEHKDIKLHKYFHHLNSSQAFALNLFFPFFEDGASSSSTLLLALRVPGELVQWRLEYLPDPDEGTNVDVAWKGPSGAWTYCEVKLSEQEFGQASDDPRHLRKLKKIYGPTLAPLCSGELLEPRTFFEHYQILRNVWLAAREPTASTVFLLPKQNAALWEPLRRVMDALQPSLRARVHIAEVEDVFRRLAHDAKGAPKLRWYAELLSEKYIVPSTAA